MPVVALVGIIILTVICVIGLVVCVAAILAGDCDKQIDELADVWEEI